MIDELRDEAKDIGFNYASELIDKLHSLMTLPEGAEDSVRLQMDYNVLDCFRRARGFYSGYENSIDDIKAEAGRIKRRKTRELIHVLENGEVCSVPKTAQNCILMSMKDAGEEVVLLVKNYYEDE